MKTAPPIKSLGKALNIIDILAEATGEMSLNEIATKLGLAKSTVHGLLSTLRGFDYVRQSPFTGKYQLGLRLFEIGNVVAHSWDVRTVAAPYIQRLVEELGETVHLVVLDKGEVLYIDKRECRRSIGIVSQVGARLPAHCTGVGKVLLAHLPVSEVKRIIAAKGLSRYTKNTITDVAVLETELHKVCAQGYAVDNEEIMEGLRCIAVPIRDHEGRACAAISISGPASRLEAEKFDSAVQLLMQTALEVSFNMGYREEVTRIVREERE